MSGWRASTGVRWRQVGEEIVLLDLGSHAYFTLDEVGGFAWTRLVAGDDETAVAAAIAAEFEVDAATAGRDLTELIAHLAGSGLLVPR